MVSPAQAVDVATKVLSERYPNAVAGFAAGSIIRGEGTLHSDLDLVVLHERLDHAWRESFVFSSLPVEVFAHDHDTLRWFIHDDVARGRPGLLGMVAEGRIIGSRPNLATSWQERARGLVAVGPPTFNPLELRSLRYQITGLIDDLRGSRPHDQTVATGVALYALLGQLALRGRGHWSGEGKWLAKSLAIRLPDLAIEFSDAFDSLFRIGHAQKVIDLAEAELQPHGGRLFDGDYLAAPPEWKAPSE